MTKKILVILGHPNTKDSLSASLANAYIKGAKSSGAQVKYLKLANLKFDGTHWPGYQDKTLEPDIKKSQTFISWADHIVFFYPTWWFSFPALLKGFVDRTFTPGFAFKFKKGGLWERYLKGRTARLVTTTGGRPLFYRLFVTHPGNMILNAGILRFCGIKPVRTTILGPARKSQAHKFTKWIQKLENMGKEFK